MRKSVFRIALLTLLGLTVLSGCSWRNRAENNSIGNFEIGSGLKLTELPLPEENSKPRTEEITHVVIHFMSNAVKDPKEPYNIEDIRSIFVENGVSSHYVIGRKGEIYRAVSEDRVAYHAGKGSLPGFPEYENKLNEYSIGIELLAIGTRGEMTGLIPEEAFSLIQPSNIGYTNAQYEALNKLIDNIILRNSLIKRDRKHIVGHDEYAPGRKTDPGSLFDWSRLEFEEGK